MFSVVGSQEILHDGEEDGRKGMITCIVHDSMVRELETLKEIVRAEAADLTADEWRIEFYREIRPLRFSLKKYANIDLLCLDLTADGGPELLRTIRKFCRNAKLLVIADDRISPMEYLRPAIHPDALLLRPADRQEMRAVIRELFQTYRDHVYRSGLAGSYMVKTRDGRTLLPYSGILYFEARSKKVYVRTGKQEYGFYGTIEHLTGVLPGDFVRCHRSFIVNGPKVRRMLLSRNLLELENRELIPVSRTYRTKIRQLADSGIPAIPAAARSERQNRREEGAQDG